MPAALIVLGALVVAAVALNTGWPVRRVGAGLVALWAAVMVVLLALPAGHPAPASMGVSRAGWQALGALGALAGLYLAALHALRRRARPVEAPAAPPAPAPAAGPFSPTELQRYSRQFLLHEIGGPGQRRLRAARVLVVGAGGLGSPVLQYLAAAGVGTLGIIDDDTVDLSNLHRQVIHTEALVGSPKVDSAAAAIRAQNPHVAVETFHERLTDVRAAGLFPRYDLIIDGTDNFATRYLVNRAAVAAGRPLIAGAMTQWEGQISLWDPARGAPCYQCVFPEPPAPGLVPSCAEAGVAGPLPGVIGSLMALEAVKEICGAGESLRGRLLIWDGLEAEARTIRLHRRADCPVCGTAAQADVPA